MKKFDLNTWRIAVVESDLRALHVGNLLKSPIDNNGFPDFTRLHAFSYLLGQGAGLVSEQGQAIMPETRVGVHRLVDLIGMYRSIRRSGWELESKDSAQLILSHYSLRGYVNLLALQTDKRIRININGTHDLAADRRGRNGIPLPGVPLFEARRLASDEEYLFPPDCVDAAGPVDEITGADVVAALQEEGIL